MADLLRNYDGGSMRRGLIEVVDLALKYKPDLLREEVLQDQFTKLIGRCILAVNQIRSGKYPERDLSILIYGKNVPRYTLEKLMTRTQRELEAFVSQFAVTEDEDTTQDIWASVLHMYSSGITAYFANHEYRSRERLSSVLTVANDPYMLPLAASAGVFLVMQRSRTDSRSNVLASIRKTREVIDVMAECWEWIAIYAELLNIAVRKYKVSSFSERLAEIRQLLEQMRMHGLATSAPQTQMVAASCAYLLGQIDSRYQIQLEWLEIYKLASRRLRRSGRVYENILNHMYVRVFTQNHDHERLVPIVQQLITDETSKTGSTANPVIVTHTSWLASSLIHLGRYKQAQKVLSGLDPKALRAANENSRNSVIILRSIASAMAKDMETPVDRRVMRMAMLQNESTDRRANDHIMRFGALTAMLMHCRQREVVYAYTTDLVIDKLSKLYRNHKDIRECRRTSAFIRLASLMESGEISTTKRHIEAVNRYMAVIEEKTTPSVYEHVPYQVLIAELYGKQLKQILNHRRQ
ncbi:MAG: hypothetical protein FGM24_05310 [Candidatus Kapabacteria bacterium]|nr:hypothetical protein [Candidatus Kapabacteria bacterium]